jgi:carboxyl-terminal processing protease
MTKLKKIACLSFLAVLLALSAYPQELKAPVALTQAEIQKMRLISEAYLQMQSKYFKPIPLERFEKFFYRNEVISASLMKSPETDFETKLDVYVYATLEWMVRELRDPTDTLSKFIHKKYLTQVVRKNIKSKFDGIGIEVEDRAAGFFVSTVYDNSSAAEEGVRVNDRILKVDQADIESLTLKDLEKLLAIPSGATLTLSLLREGENEPLDVTLTCRIIVIPSVASQYFKKEKAAYIRVAEFREETGEEVREQLAALLRKSCRGLILDLRDNDGGDMEQAVALCDLFLPQDTLVCYFLKRDVGRQDQKTNAGKMDLKDIQKVLILTNAETGSSAEIVAGTLRHYNGYALLGTKTKGMGALKNTVALSDGSALYMITSRTYLPDGSTFDEAGLAPDIMEGDNTKQLQLALQMIEQR